MTTKGKLNEESTFKKKIISNTRNNSNLEFYDIDEWSLSNLWKTKNPLYAIEQDGTLVCIDRRQMIRLYREFHKILTLGDTRQHD